MPYFYTLNKTSGHQVLKDKSCQLLKFAKLTLAALAASESYAGKTADREMLWVLLSGKARVEVGDKSFEVGTRPDVFAGLPHSVYLPRGISYRAIALSAMDGGWMAR
jgi:5-deoxy-glucuronate isomerase